jgi:hypothetical protein
MKNQSTIDMNKLNEVVDSPVLEKEFQDVFSLVEAVTGQKYEPDNLTAQDIELWNKKFDVVLKQLHVHTK